MPWVQILLPPPYIFFVKLSDYRRLINSRTTEPVKKLLEHKVESLRLHIRKDDLYPDLVPYAV